MWVAIFLVMEDLSCAPGGDWHTMGCTADRNPGKCEGHPRAYERFHACCQMSAALRLFVSSRPRETHILHRIADTRQSTTPSKQYAETLQSIAREGPAVENVLDTLPYPMREDWEEREEQREWDFLTVVYGRQANKVPYTHRWDRKAFAEYACHCNRFDFVIWVGVVGGVKIVGRWVDPCPPPSAIYCGGKIQ